MTVSRPQPFPVHLPALDGLRGVAILLVLANHLWLTNDHPGSTLVTLLTSVRVTTWVGVDLFLALSGSLITGVLLETDILRNFYARRALRILPVYWLALVVLSFFHMPWNHLAGSLLTFTQNTPFWFGHPVPYLLDAYAGHLWTISLEEQFYLVWPLAVLSLRHRPARLMQLALALAAAALLLRLYLVAHNASFQYTYKLLPCRMDTFLLGAWLALALRSPHRDRVLKQAPLALLISTLILFAVAVQEHGLDWRTSRFTNSTGYTLIGIAAVALIARTFTHPIPFTHPWLRTLGRWSYGIYIWHMIVGALPIPPIRAALAAQHIGPAPQFLAGACAATILSILLGAISYHAFEVHFLRLKRFFPESSASAIKA